MIELSFYLSEDENIGRACELTGLSLDELETIVGRFTKRSSRAGKLKGEVLKMVDGSVVIRNHFSKKKIWKTDSSFFEGY